MRVTAMPVLVVLNWNELETDVAETGYPSSQSHSDVSTYPSSSSSSSRSRSRSLATGYRGWYVSNVPLGFVVPAMAVSRSVVTPPPLTAPFLS